MCQKGRYCSTVSPTTVRDIISETKLINGSNLQMEEQYSRLAIIPDERRHQAMSYHNCCINEGTLYPKDSTLVPVSVDNIIRTNTHDNYDEGPSPESLRTEAC